MTVLLPKATRRSRFLFDWSAAACLDAPEQSLDAITGQAATFTRASVKSALDAGGAVRTVPHSLPAFHWTTDPVSGLAVPGVLLEEARTNLVLQSENFGTTWAQAGTPTRTAASDTSSGVTLDLIGDDLTGTVEGYTQTVTFTGNAAKALSLVVKQGSATSSVIRLRDTTAAANRLLAAITWSGGVPVVTMTTGTNVGTVALAGGAYRLQFVTTAVTAANTNSLEVYPATDAALNAVPVGTLLAGAVQAENALAPGAYIKTTSATVTRSADALAFPLNMPPRASTWYMQFVESGTIYSGAQDGLLGVGDSLTGSFVFLNDGTGHYAADHLEGTQVVANAVAVPTLGQRVELRGVLAADGSVVLGQSINGAAEVVTAASAALAFSSAWANTWLRFNDRAAGGNAGSSCIQTVRIAAGTQTLATMRTG